MEPDLTKLNLYTGVNYMKRSDKSGHQSISTVDLDIAHNLGYSPFFVHYAEIDNDGFIWYGAERVFEGTDSTGGGWTYPPRVDAWTTDTDLTLAPTGVSTARPVYWLIYLDYGA